MKTKYAGLFHQRMITFARDKIRAIRKAMLLGKKHCSNCGFRKAVFKRTLKQSLKTLEVYHCQKCHGYIKKRKTCFDDWKTEGLKP